jgi:hypothetical protein
VTYEGGRSRADISKYWSTDCAAALTTIKELLLSDEVLRFPDAQAEFELFTDASQFHMSSVLRQKKGVIGYSAKSFKGPQLNWSPIVKEAYAVYNAVLFFRDLVSYGKILLRCDHKPLEQFLTANTRNQMCNRWSIALMEYQIQFKWVATDDNISDCLSRLIDRKLFTPHAEQQPLADFMPRNQTCNVLRLIPCDMPQPLSQLNMIDIQKTDNYCKRIKKLLLSSAETHQQFTHVDELLFRVTTIGSARHLALVIPVHLALTVLINTHSELQHPGFDKTYESLRAKVYWKNMRKLVDQYVRGCEHCKIKHLKKNTFPNMHDTPPRKIFAKISIDLVTGYGASQKGNTAVLTAICRLSQYPFVFPIEDKTSANVIIALGKVFDTTGAPHTIQSDNGPEFTSALFLRNS